MNLILSGKKHRSNGVSIVGRRRRHIFIDTTPDAIPVFIQGGWDEPNKSVIDQDNAKTIKTWLSACSKNNMIALEHTITEQPLFNDV